MIRIVENLEVVEGIYDIRQITDKEFFEIITKKKTMKK